MNKMIAVLLGTSLLASPALAQDDGLYGTILAGPTAIEQAELASSTTDLFDVEGGIGGAVAAALGHDYGKYRLEIEGAFYNQGVDQINLRSGLRAETGGVSGLANGSGNRSAFTAMLNGLRDFDMNGKWTPYLGGGIGLGIVRNQSIGAIGTALIDDTGAGPAAQAMAGVRREISENVDFGVQVRHMRVFGGSVIDNFGNEAKSRFSATTAFASLTFLFDGRSAAPAEPMRLAAPAPEPMRAMAPPPAPAPIVQAPAPIPGPFIVFFDWDDDSITPEAASIIRDAATAYLETGQSSILLEGYADTSGNATYNQGLSARRAANVESELSRYGVNGSAVNTQAFGESSLRVETLDSVREPQNRRVQITLGN